ncbi:FMN-binding negative transcriptional regulator [Streptomyces sp. NPDC059389]|uniref:FMN-binding negative transcriptional regulator n=1 Tax=Streptomyces sp. NPDC059389 TaxID=3346818 RepID=UPI0036A843CE
MYVPPIYQPEDRGWLRRIIQRYPLATMVTNGERMPYATHLPVIFSPEDAAGTGGPEGTTLLGHMNRANSHWDSLTDGANAQLIFTGPHGYVTPTLYRTTPAAPTWNFVSVHVQGRLRLLRTMEETLDVVQRTVDAYEAAHGDGWQMDGSLDYFARIGTAVGAFRFEVESADGMFKLSQEKEPEVRSRVSERLSTTDAGPSRDLGHLMREFYLDEDHAA